HHSGKRCTYIHSHESRCTRHRCCRPSFLLQAGARSQARSQGFSKVATFSLSSALLTVEESLTRTTHRDAVVKLNNVVVAWTRTRREVLLGDTSSRLDLNVCVVITDTISDYDRNLLVCGKVLTGIKEV